MIYIKMWIKNINTNKSKNKNLKQILNIKK